MFDLSRSPIRENVNRLEEGQLSVFEDDGYADTGSQKLQVRTILRDVENMLDTMEENGQEEVRIAIMGEVKAGKSTFVNACVGKEVAYTDILEATAVVSEITCSKQEYVHVLDADGTIVKEMTTEELLAWMEEKVDEDEYFSQFDKIQIGVENEFLKGLILVDTPGLLSITSRNHDVTNKYIAQTDYILRVINSRNLGSKAVNDYISKVRLSGKPMIGIVNKVDSKQELLEIKSYIDQEYGNMFEEIFYVSAANAWDSQAGDEEDWAEKTGFFEVLECISDLCEDKERSIDQTQYFQLQREREVHVKMRERIQKRKEYYDSELAQFANMNKEMKKVIHKELAHWIRTELYMDEKEKLMNAKGADFQTLYDKYSDAEYLTSVIHQKYQEMTSFIYKKWEIVENSLMDRSSRVLVDFQYDKSIAREVDAEPQTIQKTGTADGFQAGLKGGAVMGIAFAGYSAWLGPAAATVTFASALPCVIPLAIGGALLGGYLGRKQIIIEEIQQSARKKQEAVESLCQAVRQTVIQQIEEMGKALFACTNHYYTERCSLYKEKTDLFHFDYTQPRYGEFCKKLDAYLQSLDSEIVRLGYPDLPQPPAEEEMHVL